jgi:dTDP-glucose 4,6-dehydratase
MNFLVTGGAGFIGSHLVQELLSSDHPHPPNRVVVLDALTYSGSRQNLTEVESDERFEFVAGDIADQKLVAGLLSQHRITGIFNLAAETHVDRSIDSPEPFLKTNVMGTLGLLESAQDYYSHLEGAGRCNFRFLHVSTDEVFGSLAPTDPPFSESTVFRLQGGKRPSRTRLRSYLRTPHSCDELFQ